MAIKCRLQRVEPESLGLHVYLDNQDECYYIGEYTSGENYSYSKINQLIYNLKKDPQKKATNPHEYRYKTAAIEGIGDCLKRIIRPEALEETITLMPIPPSKTRAHPKYDDRILQVCNNIVTNTRNPDVVELIQCTADMDATHNQDRKPTPEELIVNYTIVKPQNYSPRNRIFIVDDMLTTGSHFKACKQMLSGEFPESTIVGVFITKRVFPPIF